MSLEARTGEGHVPPKGYVLADNGEALRPPFDLTSDMLFVLAFCPTAPLRDAFKKVPFLSIMGRTPLAVWFSRVKVGCYRTGAGEERCVTGEMTLPYSEMTVIAILKERAVFAPGIFATSHLTIKIGDLYGMGKEPAEMSFEGRGRQLRSRVRGAARLGFVRARLLGTGRLATRLLSVFLPLRAWPARFPAGVSEPRMVVKSVRRVHLVRVQAGELSPGIPWLPEPVRFLPVGIYARDLLMRVPPP